MRKIKTVATAARFQKGDRVKVSDVVVFPQDRGRVDTVRRVFWVKSSGDQSAGWVCELDIQRRLG